MRARPAATVALVAALVVSAGCLGIGADDGDDRGSPEGRDPTRPPAWAPWAGPNVTLAGRVTDAATGAALANATVTVQLVAGDPCGTAPRLSWQAWDVPVAGTGRFGPSEVPGPRVNGSFEFRAEAPGFVPVVDEVVWRPATNDTLPEVTLAVHPAARVTVPAPEGARVAWYRGDAPAAFDVTDAVDADPVLELPAGRVHGVVLAGNATPRAVTADAPAHGSADATPVPSPENATAIRVNVTLGDAPATGAVVLAVAEDGWPVTAGVTGENGTAALVVPGDADVTVYARSPSGDARGVGAVDAGVAAVTLTRPGCPAADA